MLTVHIAEFGWTGNPRFVHVAPASVASFEILVGGGIPTSGLPAASSLARCPRRWPPPVEPYTPGVRGGPGPANTPRASLGWKARRNTRDRVMGVPRIRHFAPPSSL